MYIVCIEIPSLLFSTKNVCLRLYVRNRSAYNDIRASKCLGTLPHPSVLTEYKNKVPQVTGINGGLLNWMDEEAGRLAVSSHGRLGGLIVDEMNIQVHLIYINFVQLKLWKKMASLKAC